MRGRVRDRWPTPGLNALRVSLLCRLKGAQTACDVRPGTLKTATAARPTVTQPSRRLGYLVGAHGQQVAAPEAAVAVLVGFEQRLMELAALHPSRTAADSR